LATIDLQSGKRSIVPSSHTLDGPIWIDPKALVAGNDDQTKLVLLDINTGRSTELASGVILDWAASADRKYLYYTTGGTEPRVMRIRLEDHHPEEIGSLKGLRRAADRYSGRTWISIAPDGSPVFTRDIGSQEVYALTIKWP
jgi:hypothetical protein